MIFFYVLQKNSRNKLCVTPHDTELLFRTFFSQVNNKVFLINLKQINFNQDQTLAKNSRDGWSLAGGAAGNRSSYSVIPTNSYCYRKTLEPKS